MEWKSANVKISELHWEGKYAIESKNHHDNFYIITVYFLHIIIIHFSYISLKHEKKNSYINVPSPYRSCLSSIITAKIKVLALSLKAVKKNQSYFSCFTARKTRLSEVQWFTQECPSLFWLSLQKQGILSKSALRVWEHIFRCKDWIQLIRSNYYA